MTEPLTSSQLFHPCDINAFNFKTTDELEPLTEIIGQDSALKAVDFGTNIQQEGYNLYAMGPSGSGKHSVITEYLQKKAADEPTPGDWCYVNNFKDNRKPNAIEFPPGEAIRFKDDINELIVLFQTILPAIFESNEYRNAKEAINQKYLDMQSEIFQYLQAEAEKHDVSMNTASPSRVTFVPIIDGKVLTPEEFKAIEGEEKEKIMAKMSEFELIVKQGLREISMLNKAQQQEFMALDRKTTADAVEAIIDELRRSYADMNEVVDYLNALEENVVANVKDFLAKPEEMGLPPFMVEFYAPSFHRYKVNVFITRDKEEAAPVVYEDNPSHQNLIGAIEHTSKMGTLVTDFSMLKPGAFHKANGGYLVLDVRRLLMQPFAWEELKRVLRSKEVRMESLAQQYSLISTTTLEPEPIPINVKVVLIGERLFYYLLYHYDPDFKELFKVSADFEEDMPRDENNTLLYAQMIGTIVKKSELLPLTSDAVARVIEQGSRDADNASKISTHLGTLADLLKEADYWARKENRDATDKRDIETALKAQTDRMNRIQNRLLEQIREGTIMINTTGESVGQINALTFIQMGGHRFGMPSRITARTRMGKGEVVDIQRKAELSGPIHSKGVMILSSYLGSKYAQKTPLTLSASLAFEQSYGMIEGDSASSTELYALLSSLSGLPIRQNIAVTGSVNQFGEIQAVGGVNEKIEGFFDVCMQQDPEGTYGVIIPEANVRHLMLKQEIVDAAEKGAFAVYAVKTVDEGIAILTGIEAGEADDEGNYPEDSVNGKVIAQLNAYTEALRAFNRSMKGKTEEEKEEE